MKRTKPWKFWNVTKISYQQNLLENIIEDARESHGKLTAAESVGQVPFVGQGKLLNVLLTCACHRGVKRRAHRFRGGRPSSCCASLLTRNRTAKG